jgi:hypothetical protein
MIVIADTTPQNYLVLPNKLARLRQTSFYVSPEVLNPLLQRYAKKR